MNERLLDICIKAGINTWPFNEVGFISLDESELVKFAALVEAQEREECSKVCIQMANRCDDIRKAALEAAAEAIRARGTT